MNAIDVRRSTGRDIVVGRLREAIVRRSELRPGSRAHWMNECEIRILQRDLVNDTPSTATLGSTRHRPVG
jgi:hypothetical protein